MEETIKQLVERFKPKNNTIIYITQMADATRSPEETLLAFLDRLKGMAKRGGLPHDVLVAMALKALPLEFTNRLVVTEKGITWDALYASCGVWEYSGLDNKAQTAGTFAINRSKVEKKEAEILLAFSAISPVTC